jgi:hypothetical protein
MPKLTVSLTESPTDRLAWLTKDLDMAGIKASESEIVGTLIKMAQRDALEDAFKDN